MNVKSSIVSLSTMYQIIVNKLVHWLEIIVDSLPNAVLALLVILFFSFVSGYIRRFSLSLMQRVSSNISLVNLTGLIASRLFLLVGFFVALDILGLEKTVTSLLAGAGIIGLALGFAFQDLTANFLSGIFITIGQPIRVNDIIATNGITGKVKEIKIRSTILDNFEGQEIEIPSRKIFENPIVNHSKVGGNRMEVKWRVSQQNDLEKVEHLAIQTVKALRVHDPKHPVELHYTGFDGTNVNFVLWFWISTNNLENYPKATSAAVKAIKKAFETNEIKV